MNHNRDCSIFLPYLHEKDGEYTDLCVECEKAQILCA